MKRFMTIVLSAALLLATMGSPGYASDHKVAYPALVEYYHWTRGCTPTATAMVISYYDHLAIGVGKYIQWGKIIGYYSSPDGRNNVPNLLYDLAQAMETSSAGATYLDKVSPGIKQVLNERRGYSFESGTSFYAQCDDNCWNKVKTEIASNRPFVWHVEGYPSGHSTAAWGYTDARYVILYDTWDSDPLLPYTQYREDWYYQQVFSGRMGKAITTVQYKTVPGPNDLVLLQPSGKIRIPGGGEYSIGWYQWGDITHVQLSYSVDNGATWKFIKLLYPSAGAGYHKYLWAVPCVSSGTVRVKVQGFAMYGLLNRASDGSFDEFTIIPAILASPGTLNSDKSTVSSNVIYTLTWSPVPGALSYDVCENGLWQNVDRVTSKQYSKSTPGTFVYKVRARNGCGPGPECNAITVRVTSTIAVWPGDLNGNGRVENTDILCLARSWNQNGKPRAEVDSRWDAHQSESWDEFPATFADADGNGTVDIADFEAICLNFGKQHSGTAPGVGAQQEPEGAQNREALKLFYDVVKNESSGPKEEIKRFLAAELGVAPPSSFILKQNYPNPFNPTTSMIYEVPTRVRVRIAIYNVAGQEVKTLVDREHETGSYSAIWDGKDRIGRPAAAGIYLCRLESGAFTTCRKMVLVR